MSAHRTAATALLLALGLSLSACSSGSTSPSTGDSAASAASDDVAVGGAAAAPEPAAAGGADALRSADLAFAEDATAPTSESPQTPAIISTGSIRSTSDDVAAARRAALRVVADLGGTVADENTRTDTDGEATRSHLVLRVPSRAFGEAMDRLKAIGDERASSTAAEDVTTQVVDTAVRIRVQRAGIRRITALLGRAGSLGAVLRIESELSRRQADLESLLQQRKYLADQTSLATITLQIDRTGVVPDDEDRSGFLGGLRSGWDAFTSAAVGLATALGAAVPFAVLGLLLAGVALPVWRRRRGARDQSAIG